MKNRQLDATVRSVAQTKQQSVSDNLLHSGSLSWLHWRVHTFISKDNQLNTGYHGFKVGHKNIGQVS